MVPHEILYDMQSVDLAISNIKGLSAYTKENQQLLLSKFEYKEEIEKFIELSDKRGSYKVSHNGKPLYINIRSRMIGLSYENNKTYQLTNHTLYTLIDEFELDILKFEEIK